MSVTRVEDLWTRFLEEGQLPPAEEQELLRALEQDETLRNRLLGDKEMDGLLDSATGEEEPDAFVRSFQDRLSVEGDDSRFIAKVEEKIRRAPARRPRRPGGSSGSSPWTLAVVAAGVLAALVFLVTMLGSEAPRAVVKTPKALPVVVPEPVPPPSPVPAPPKAPEIPPAPAPVNRPEPDPAPRPEPPPTPVVPAPKDPPAVPEKKVTEVVVARLERVDGDVRPAQPGDLASGARVETLGAKSSATILYPDGTRLVLGPETAVADLLDAGRGKSLTVEKGALSSDVVKQTAPMVLKTPHAEARVLGTAFRLTVEAASTRLDVTSGKVRLTRTSDGKSVDVVAGQFAVAGAGLELAAKSSAPKPKPVLLQETFQDPRSVDLRWKTVGTPALVKTAGTLDITLSTKTPGADGWSGAGLLSRQAFASPLALSIDVDVPVLHGSVVTAVVFIPQGQKRGEGVFRIQLRGERYSITTEAGEPRDVTTADRAGGSPCRERWRVEIDGAVVRLMVQDREVLRHKLETPIAGAYSVGFDASARSDAPSGSRASFDNLVVEPLK